MKLGHAYCSENNNTTGTAGNQTGKELRFQDWYNRAKGWTHVFRAKDEKVREAIAVACEQAVHNQKIGYDQNQRTTLYTQAQKHNFDISKVDVACECDCSSLVAVCINASGIKICKDMYTGNEEKLIKETKAFTTYTADKYLTTDKNLKRGDILLGPGHTAICLGEKIKDDTHNNNTSVKETPNNSNGGNTSTKKTGTFYRVQIAACKSEYSAQTYRDRLSKKGFPSGTIVHESGYYKNIAGVFETLKEANEYAKKLQLSSFSTYVYAITVK